MTTSAPRLRPSVYCPSAIDPPLGGSIDRRTRRHNSTHHSSQSLCIKQFLLYVTHQLCIPQHTAESLSCRALHEGLPAPSRPAAKLGGRSARSVNASTALGGQAYVRHHRAHTGEGGSPGSLYRGRGGGCPELRAQRARRP